MQCEEIAELLPQVVDGLETADHRVVRHVESCLRCQAEIAGPPPCTSTGRMPTKRNRTTSWSTGSGSPPSIAAPPSLMTTVCPAKRRM